MKRQQPSTDFKFLQSDKPNICYLSGGTAGERAFQTAARGEVLQLLKYVDTPFWRRSPSKSFACACRTLVTARKLTMNKLTNNRGAMSLLAVDERVRAEP